jgi:hypothetical protein
VRTEEGRCKRRRRWHVAICRSATWIFLLLAGCMHAAGATARVVLSAANDMVLWPLALSLWRPDRAWTVRACVAELFVWA